MPPPPRRDTINLSENRQQKAQSMINLLSDFERAPNQDLWIKTPHSHSRRSVTDPSPVSCTPSAGIGGVELVQPMTIRFGGVKCTCGCVARPSPSQMHFPGYGKFPHSHSEHDLLSALTLRRSSFTFQLVLPDPIATTAPTYDKGIRKFSSPLRPLSAFEYDIPRAVADPEWLKAKGHGEKLLKLGPNGEIMHPNPLRSNEVNPMAYLDLGVKNEWEVYEADSIGFAHEGSPVLYDEGDEGYFGDEGQGQSGEPDEKGEDSRDWERRDGFNMEGNEP